MCLLHSKPYSGQYLDGPVTSGCHDSVSCPSHSMSAEYVIKRRVSGSWRPLLLVPVRPSSLPPKRRLPVARGTNTLVLHLARIIWLTTKLSTSLALTFPNWPSLSSPTLYQTFDNTLPPALMVPSVQSAGPTILFFQWELIPEFWGCETLEPLLVIPISKLKFIKLESRLDFRKLVGGCSDTSMLISRRNEQKTDSIS